MSSTSQAVVFRCMQVPSNASAVFVALRSRKLETDAGENGTISFSRSLLKPSQTCLSTTITFKAQRAFLQLRAIEFRNGVSLIVLKTLARASETITRTIVHSPGTDHEAQRKVLAAELSCRVSGPRAASHPPLNRSRARMLLAFT